MEVLPCRKPSHRPRKNGSFFYDFTQPNMTAIFTNNVDEDESEEDENDEDEDDEDEDIEMEGKDF